MAKVQQAPKEQKAVVSEIPSSFPAGQLFVGVSESSGEYAGYASPRRGGRGLWPRGGVGEWTSDDDVPLALRDPDTGIIWKGYLEPVIQSARAQDGSLECLQSQQFFAIHPSAEARREETAKRQAASKAKPAAPTGKAAKRAQTGPKSHVDGMKGSMPIQK